MSDRRNEVCENRDPWSVVECDEHGDCSAYKGVCVLCANGTDAETIEMGPMIGLEQVLRGQTASFEEIQEMMTEGEET